MLTENSMFFLSWLTALGSGTGSVCLMMDTDSPKEKIVRDNCTELDLLSATGIRPRMGCFDSDRAEESYTHSLKGVESTITDNITGTKVVECL